AVISVSSPRKRGPSIPVRFLQLWWTPVPSAFTGSPLPVPAKAGIAGTTERSPLQDKTHRAERAKLMCVDQHAALLDAKCIARAPQHIAIFADIFAHALVAAEAIADEVRRDRDQVAFGAKDTHVRDHPPRARLRKLGMAVRIVDADHALADA